MKSMSVCLTALALLAPSAVLAVGKYDREKICLKENNYEACDLLIEQAVAKQAPGVIERKGNVLSIHLRNGKTVELVADKNCGECCNDLWVCNYLPDRAYVEICHRCLEWSKTVFININSGKSVSSGGVPVYSPSGRRALMVEASDGAVDGVEIWRFDRKRPVKEFKLEDSSANNEDAWFQAVWKSETEIQANAPSSSPPASYHLIKKGDTWEFKEK